MAMTNLRTGDRVVLYFQTRSRFGNSILCQSNSGRSYQLKKRWMIYSGFYFNIRGNENKDILLTEILCFFYLNLNLNFYFCCTWQKFTEYLFNVSLNICFILAFVSFNFEQSFWLHLTEAI